MIRRDGFVTPSPPLRDENGQLAEVLRWGGAVLVIVYAFTVLKTMLPLAVMQPQWLARVSAVLRDSAPIPLMGVMVMLLATRIDPDSTRLRTQVRRVRFLALFAAWGFLLLIPVQIYAGAGQLRSGFEGDQQRLGIVREAARQISAARTEEEMKKAITSLPGAPNPEAYRFTTSIEAVRANILRQIQPQIQAAERRLADVRRQQIFNALPIWISDAIVAALFAVGFGAVAQRAPGRPSLLDGLLWKGSRLLRRPGKLRGALGPEAPIDSKWLNSMHGDGAADADGGSRRRGGARPKRAWGRGNPQPKRGLPVFGRKAGAPIPKEWLESMKPEEDDPASEASGGKGPKRPQR